MTRFYNAQVDLTAVSLPVSCVTARLNAPHAETHSLVRSRDVLV